MGLSYKYLLIYLGIFSLCSIFGLAIDVTSCQPSISEDNVYNVTQNITSDGTCISMGTVDNVTIDCGGYFVRYANNDNGSSGIVISNSFDITVKNCNFVQVSADVNNSAAINLNNASHSTFSFISIDLPDSDQGNRGVFFDTDSNPSFNIFHNLTITGIAGQLIYIKDGNHNNFTDSFLNTTTAFEKKAIEDDGNSSYFHNLTVYSIVDNGYGGDSHSGSTVINNSFFEANNSAGVSTGGSGGGITIEYSTISSPGSGLSSALGLGGSPSFVRHSTLSSPSVTPAFLFSSGHYFLNTTFSTDSSAAVTLGFDGMGMHINETRIIDSTLISNGTWFASSSGSVDNNFSNTIFLTNAGSIRLIDNFIVPASSSPTPAHLNISTNSAFLNSTAFSYLNVSGQITLHNITNTDPQPLVDLETTNTFSACSSICTEESFSSNTFIFNVSHFTTFSSNESAQDIDNDNILDAEDPLVGNMSHVTGIPPASLAATVGGSSTITGNITGVKEFILRESGNLLLNFSHNFTASAINLSKFTIVHSGAGIVVNLSGQLVGNKTLYIPDTGFTSLCVKDAEITSLSQISASCTGASETDFTSCLGSAGPTTINGIDCYDQGSLIRVDNLTHSGVRGTGGASVSGATILNEGQSSSFTESTAGSDNAQATNVTEINFSTTASTTKWQGYFGNVEGNLRMGSGSNILYNFGSLPVTQIVAVFASTDTNFDFSSTTASTAGAVDTVWSFTTGDADSSTNVFADGTATISDVSSVPIANLTAYTSAGVLSTSLYQSGVLTDGGSISAGEYNSLAFGVNVDANERDFSNSTVIDFELIVPVNGSGQATTQSYFFFMDIS